MVRRLLARKRRVGSELVEDELTHGEITQVIDVHRSDEGPQAEAQAASATARQGNDKSR
jgi:hypothetical protein